MRPGRRLASVGAAFAVTVSAVLAAAAGTILLSACGSCDSFVHQTSMPLLAAGTFDGVAADQPGHRLYFADQANQAVDVVDVSGASPRFKGRIDLPAAPNGLAFAAPSQRLYAGMDGGHVAVIDTDGASPRFMQVIDDIAVDGSATTPTADLMDYSPETHRLFVGTAGNGSIVMMDAATGKTLKTFALGSPVEQPRFDPADGKLYVTTPHTNSIVELDPASGKVVRTLKQSGCEPAGLAINPSRQLAMVACRGSMAVFNLRTGLDEVSTKVPGGDLVTYDAAVDRFTVGSPHGPRDSAVGVFDGSGRFVGMVAATPNAHGAVFDDRTGMLYAVGSGGLLGFSPAACAPPPDWLTFTGGALVFIGPLVLLSLFLFFYARRRSRMDRSGRRSPTREDLLREDLAAERERMRALEDAIYGPEGG
jgi:DNA-binding beta-propeller fold protein YncE